MTLVTGTVQDLGYDPLDGVLYARPARFRSDGGVVLAPERIPYPLEAGMVSVELAPGPAVLELKVGSHARGTFDVVIPDQASITLAELLDLVFPWEPEQISKFVIERKASEAAAAAAGAAQAAAVAAKERAILEHEHVHLDAAHVDAVAAQLPVLLDQANVFAQDQVPPYLQTAALNATYATKGDLDTLGGVKTVNGTEPDPGGNVTVDVPNPTITGRYAGPDLAPVYISTIETGLVPDTPANIRAGLPTTTAPGGGFSAEMTIAVTGTVGSTVLTSTETAKVAGLGSVKFEAVLNATDGTNDFFVTVLSHNGSNQLTLRAPLARAFTGTLSSKYDANLGQHLTKAATRAYAQHAATYSGALGAKGRILAGVWEHRPATYYTDVWKLNAALTAYGVSNSADSPVVRTEMTVGGVHNILLAVDRMPMYPAYKATGPNVGTHLTGHGAEATLYTGRRNAVLEFFTSGQRGSTGTAAGHRLRVTVTGDGATLYDQTHDGWLTRVNVPVNGFDRVLVSVTNDQDNPVTLRLSSLILREAGTSGRVGQGRVVALGDSWFGYYDGEFAKALAAKTGAQVVNHGLGGTTTEWALDWFDQYVLAEKPDECWLHFFTNDLNNNQTGATYVAPDGTTKPLWPTGLTSDQARDRWMRNLATLIYRCQKAGIRPVIIKPGGTASENQMQRHVVASSEMEKPAVADWNAMPAEVADVAAYVNVVGKRTGAQLTVAGQPRYAAGPNPADVWAAPTAAV